jgi:hypothetical protein
MIAASIAGTPAPTSLLQLTTGLDDTNGRYVLDALAHRFGWHERGTVHSVTGQQTVPAQAAYSASGRQAHHG